VAAGSVRLEVISGFSEQVDYINPEKYHEVPAGGEGRTAAVTQANARGRKEPFGLGGKDGMAARRPWT